MRVERQRRQEQEEKRRQEKAERAEKRRQEKAAKDVTVSGISWGFDEDAQEEEDGGTTEDGRNNRYVCW